MKEDVDDSIALLEAGGYLSDTALSDTPAFEEDLLMEELTAQGSYNKDLQRSTPLDPDEEVELALQIEASELNIWGLILSHKPSLKRLGGTIKNHLKGRSRSLFKKYWQGRAGKAILNTLCVRIRESDRDLRLLRLCLSTSRLRLPKHVHEAIDRARQLRDHFISCNLRLVVRIAAHHRHIGPIQDLIQDGNLGLLRAVNRFDPHRGFRFSTYASWWIRQSITRGAVSQKNGMKTSVHTMEMNRKIWQVAARLSMRQSETVTPEQISKISGISVTRINQIQFSPFARPMVSLDQSLGSDDFDDSRTYLDIVEDPGAEDPLATIERKEVQGLITEALSKLPQMEREILQYRFGIDGTEGGDEGQTLAKISDKYGLTRERIRQIQVVAMERIKKLVQV